MMRTAEVKTTPGNIPQESVKLTEPQIKRIKKEIDNLKAKL